MLFLEIVDLELYLQKGNVLVQWLEKETCYCFLKQILIFVSDILVTTFKIKNGRFEIS